MTYQNEKEFAWLLDKFKVLQPRRVLEIGSLTGETLEHWVSQAPRGSTIVSIDQVVPRNDARWHPQRLGHDVIWPRMARSFGQTFYVFDGDSRDPYIVQTVRQLFEGGLDFVFIDGGHDFDTCCNDYQNYGLLVRPGGLIAFHDLGQEWPDVRRVWESIKEPFPREEFCISPRQYGIGVLHV